MTTTRNRRRSLRKAQLPAPRKALQPVRISTHCPRTDKVIYLSRGDAELALQAMRRRRAEGEHGPVRTYRCGFCSLWHLTSQPYRELGT